MTSNNETEKYSEMVDQVEKILKELSAEKVDLDTMLTKVEQGYQIMQKMQSRLSQVKMSVEKLQETYGVDIK
tara:strand:+ start:277 stop:492 length:216 start_codon:yes stop_codon:yes gene_type:complete